MRAGWWPKSRKIFIVIAITIVMATTIQVSETTKQMLQMLKEEEHATSYEEVIRQMLDERLNVPKSMLGALKGFRWKKSEDRLQFHER